MYLPYLNMAYVYGLLFEYLFNFMECRVHKRLSYDFLDNMHISLY